MENTTKLNINATGATELIIREGQALPLAEPTPVVFSGLLHAPRMFFESRRALLKKTDCHLIVDNHEGSIVFCVDEKSKYKDTIKGKLSGSKIIEEFTINKEEMYTDKELAKLFKMNAYYFADNAVHAQILKSLLLFTAKVDKEIENNKDPKGNYKKLIEATVVHNVPDKFIMKAPLFEGYPPVEFTVFICSEASTNSVEFYLESPDLYRMQEENKRALIKEELVPFVEFGCPILHK